MLFSLFSCRSGLSPAAAPTLLLLDTPLLAPAFFPVRHMFPSSCAMIFFRIPFSIRSSLPIFLTKKEPQPSGPRLPFAISIHSWRHSVPARMNLPVLTSRPRSFYPRAAYVPPFYSALPSPVPDRVSSVLLLYVLAARSGIAQNASLFRYPVPQPPSRIPPYRRTRQSVWSLPFQRLCSANTPRQSACVPWFCCIRSPLSEVISLLCGRLSKRAWGFPPLAAQR